LLLSDSIHSNQQLFGKFPWIDFRDYRFSFPIFFPSAVDPFSAALWLRWTDLIVFSSRIAAPIVVPRKAEAPGDFNCAVPLGFQMPLVLLVLPELQFGAVTHV
jgi:hypothetical protein